MNRCCSVLCLIVLAAMTGLPAASVAVTNTVKMQAQSSTNWTFNPSNSVISVGDTITWTNTQSAQRHDSTAGRPDTGTNNGWASDPLFANVGSTFSFTFSNVGV